MTELWLVRHGQTEWNLEGRYQGQADPPLNATGRAQAEALAAELAGRAFAAVYTSDLQRARATAEIIAGRLDLPVRADARLREIHLGRWEGMLIGDIRAQYPAEWAARAADPWHAGAPGGETAAQVAARVRAVAAEIAHAHPGEAVIVVGHGFTLALVLAEAQGVPLAQAYTLVPDNCHPHVVEWGG